MRIGTARIDFEANVIHGTNGTQIVEPKVMQLLEVLAENPNVVMSREDLITAVWGVSFGGDERLSRAVSLLRKALGEEKGQRKYIETISRRGYRLIADISSAEATNIPLKTEEAKPFPQRKSLTWLPVGIISAVITALLIFMFLPKTKSFEDFSISDSLEAGYDNIQYFGHPGAIESAQNHFKNILKQEPQNAAAHAGLALAYIRQYTSAESDPTLLKQAKSSALKALQENEHLALSHIAMGWASEFNKEPAKALQYLEQADLLDKDNALTLESRVRVFARRGAFDDAEMLLLQAIELHPQNAIFQTNIATVNLFKNDFAKAENFAKKAIEIDPENPKHYASAAQILHLQNKTDEAIKTIQDGLAVHETAALYNNLGTYLFFDGHYELAASAFEKTLELNGNTHDPLFWANLADAYRWIPDKKGESTKYYKRAIQLCKDALKDTPQNLGLQTRIALYEAKLQSGKKPEPLLDQIIETENLQPFLYYRALVTSELWGDRERALHLLRQSLNSGYPLTEIRNDPELQTLREDQAYHLILSEQAK